MNDDAIVVEELRPTNIENAGEVKDSEEVKEKEKQLSIISTVSKEIKVKLMMNSIC